MRKTLLALSLLLVHVVFPVERAYSGEWSLQGGYATNFWSDVRDSQNAALMVGHHWNHVVVHGIALARDRDHVGAVGSLEFGRALRGQIGIAAWDGPDDVTGSRWAFHLGAEYTMGSLFIGYHHFSNGSQVFGYDEYPNHGWDLFTIGKHW